MNRIYSILLPIVLASVGCVTLPSLKDEPAAKSNPAKTPVANTPGFPARQDPALPPVNPDDVTDGNAREKAEALRRELSREDK